MNTSDKMDIKIGQPVHLLRSNGMCAAGFITSWDTPGQTASVIAFPGPPWEESFVRHFAGNPHAKHDPSCAAVPVRPST